MRMLRLPPRLSLSDHARRVRLLAWLAVAVAAALVAFGLSRLPWDAPAPPSAVKATLPKPPLPPTRKPTVEPLVLVEMTPERARVLNAAVPIVPRAIAAARPFAFAGSAEDRARARVCLAQAAWYEAGQDRLGQQAVVQVVLNRVRHPAYPKTICGVVFQGSERRTGCQFTFTCDGSLARVPSATAWKAALAVADAGLARFVLAAVGTATHYHTDWVVPYWSASLDKVAQIDTHLFFRWRGWWGEPGAFKGRYAGGEQAPPIPGEVPVPAASQLAARGTLVPSDAIITLDRRAAVTVAGVNAAKLGGNIVRLADAVRNQYFIELDAGDEPISYALAASAICAGKAMCSVFGWIEPEKIPTTTPVALPILRSASFLYRKNAESGREQVFLNCSQRASDPDVACLPGTG